MTFALLAPTVKGKGQNKSGIDSQLIYVFGVRVHVLDKVVPFNMIFDPKYGCGIVKDGLADMLVQGTNQLSTDDQGQSIKLYRTNSVLSISMSGLLDGVFHLASTGVCPVVQWSDYVLCHKHFTGPIRTGSLC